MDSSIETVGKGLAASHDKTLVHKLIESYLDAKRNFYLGGLRLSAVEGGRFCEAAFRILEERIDGTGNFTPLLKIT